MIKCSNKRDYDIWINLIRERCWLSNLNIACNLTLNKEILQLICNNFVIDTFKSRNNWYNK